jgi:serine/threonine-protein kinase
MATERKQGLIGGQLGSFEVLSWLGAGGMGEVYRAHDRALGRDVALKILPHTVADDPDRVARFAREARVLASLNHPHIAAIYGLVEADGVRSLVLELVEGPTLAERIRQGALPLDEAVSIARQIAEALEAAHEKGVVHRDLKPANIKVSSDSSVKVLDFGLAKALETSSAGGPTESPTTTSADTRPGVILGTAAYMSPEQARGQMLDKRTDIWAFGCVLYELLSGHPAFPGATVSDTIAAVLQREPDWARLPSRTPGGVRRLLRRCLTKDSRQRLRDIGDARVDLEEAFAPGDETGTVNERSLIRRRNLTVAIAAVATAAAGGLLLIGMLRAADDGPRQITRTTVLLPAHQELDISGGASPLALSPDGRRLAYVARTSARTTLYVRDLNAFEATPVTGTDGAAYPFFSPDGQSLAFFADGKLKRVSLPGGSPVTVCDVPVGGHGGTWGPDDTIVFDPGASGLMRVQVRGGTAERVTSEEPEMDSRDLSWPQFLPGGRALIATVGHDEYAPLVVLSLDTRRWQRIGEGFQAQYVPTGHLIFHAPGVREGELQAVGFDAERLAVDGDPRAVVDGVFRSQGAGGAYFAAGGGHLVFARGGHARMLVRVDRHGRRTPLLDERRGFRIPRISPDGRHVAVTVDPRPSQVWVYDLARRSGVPLATQGHSMSPVWTPDGRQVTYTTNAGHQKGDGELFWRTADAGRAAEQLLTLKDWQHGSAWSSDGRTLFFSNDHPTSRVDIWMLTRDGDPRPLIVSAARELAARLSPDDRWLAYASDESGRMEVYVRPFPNVGAGKWPVSTDGGSWPVWAPSGRELFYLDGSAMMSVALGQDPTFRVGSPELLFTGPFETGSPQFDISPDGTYFIMVEADPDARPTQIHVVLNWLEELRYTGTTR